MSNLIRFTIPLRAVGSRYSFTHPLKKWAHARPATSVALWVGVSRDSSLRGLDFLPNQQRTQGEMVFDASMFSVNNFLVFGVTFDKDHPTKEVVKLKAQVVSIGATHLMVEAEDTPHLEQRIGYAVTKVSTKHASELVDHDELAPQQVVDVKAPATPLMSDTQAVFAKLASTCTLMDNTHLPVKVAADVTNCPDFADFQRALDAAGFTLRFAPKDAAAANLAAMSETDVAALLKRIPSDTLARELTKRGMEVIG